MRDPKLIDALDEMVRSVHALDDVIDRTDADVDQLIESWWWLDHGATDGDEGGMCQRLNKLRDALKAKIAPVMADAGEKTRVTDLGIVHQSKPPKPKGFNNERLLRDVEDSRTFDPTTGEMVEESPVDKIRACFSLTGHNARKTALKARGLDLISYAEDPDWQKPTVRWAT